MACDFTLDVRIDDDGPMPAPGEAFYVSNENYEAYNGLTGYARPSGCTVKTDEDGDVLVTMPDGLRVVICRVPLDGKERADAERTQLSVFIGTEEMTTDHVDGTPQMQVLLNDATLYDAEPTR